MEMMADITLGDIESVATNIKVMSSRTIKLLHELIFEEDDERKNRANLRSFSGFKYDDESEEYERKVAFIRNKFTKKELCSICTVLSICPMQNDEEELIKEILKYLCDLQTWLMNDERDEDDEENENDEENRSNDEEENEVRSNEANQGRTIKENSQVKAATEDFQRCYIDCKHLEDTVRTFDGKSKYTVERWITDFEELADMLRWNKLQKFIFAKKSLKGLAKLYIMSEKNINSWKKIKEALINEFSERTSIVDLHKELARRTMRNDESVHEYFLIMKELSSRGTIDDKSLIQYIIEGIQDTPENKIMLYGSKNLREFKDKLHHYSTFRAEYKINKIYKPKASTSINKQGEKVRCYNCGEEGHRAVQCAARDKGTKCFKCNNYGLMATITALSAQCTIIESKKLGRSFTIGSVSVSESHRMCKKVKLKDITILALVDTGSAVNLVSEEVVRRTDIANIEKSNLKMYGFGGKEITAKGCIQFKIEIKNEEYNVTFQIVPSDVMPNEMILDNPFLNEVEIFLKKDDLKI